MYRSLESAKCARSGLKNYTDSKVSGLARVLMTAQLYRRSCKISSSDSSRMVRGVEVGEAGLKSRAGGVAGSVGDTDSREHAETDLRSDT